jgi:uncharacterized protein YjlB
MSITTIKFSDDGAIPNNHLFPLTVYSNAVRGPDNDFARRFELLFLRNGWGSCWRNGIFQFPHYHSTTHEILGIAKGNAQVRFGGARGRILSVKRGDAVLIPAGIGHERIASSSDFLVVGAYPAGFAPDVLGPGARQYGEICRRIADVPIPHLDPISGVIGPVKTIWGRIN